MPLQKLLDNASPPAEGILTSSVYEFVDSEPRQLLIGGTIGEAVIMIELSPGDKATWFSLTPYRGDSIITVQAQPGAQLRITLERDQNARVNAWI